ncbi:hypothetical protein E2C01_063174 [Portunus trituberculatus]|uniref:Uncharacterized protein n=1 Tax=Portunus trituberculatus TaxID=210409 RepID=A0A5B7H8H3_PORTR|nr:hypothetical protein [Portunus trituberculatus]
MKRKSKDDTFICRVPRHPASFSYEFENHGIVYPEDTYNTLAYLDCVHVDNIGKLDHMALSSPN